MKANKIEEYAEKYPFYPFVSERGAEVIAVDDECVVAKMTHLSWHTLFLNGYCIIPTTELPDEYLKIDKYGCLPFLDIPCDVHGGLTYGEKEDKYAVFGFDTAHLGDEYQEELKDPDYIMAEAKRMKEQILEAARAKKRGLGVA